MFAQQKNGNASLFEGIIVGGYVNNAAYLNFLGPNINFSKGESKLFIGLLPSLRFKEDKGATKNSIAIPMLGAGITYTYKHLVFQLPFYYTAKTASTNGKWNAGIGMGLRLNKLKKK
ncbi:MAG: hypothetical protein FJY19_02660 [Bacteroidetes bacterium]|nr:hypothetical protein [Bacteroidota bacterium]